MRIISLLPSELYAHLVDVLGDAHVLHAAGDAIELHRLISSVDAGLVILDPGLRDGIFVDDIERALSDRTAPPMLIYTTVCAKSMAAVLRLANRGVRHMVLFAVDDDPWFFRELVERIPAYPVVDLMMDELRVSLALLPQRVTRAIQLLFESPTRAHTSSELAQLAGLTRRSLYRLMSPAGLQPRKVVDCAHLLRAYTLLSVPGSRLKETSTRLGFAAPQTLTDLLREWTGHTTRTIQRGVPPGTFVRLLSNTLYEGIAPALTESVGSVAQAS